MPLCSLSSNRQNNSPTIPHRTTIQPVAPQHEPTLTIEDVGTGISDWLPRCLDNLTPLIADGVLTLCKEAPYIDSENPDERPLAALLRKKGVTAHDGRYAKQVARYALRYHRQSPGHLTGLQQQMKEATEKLLANHGTGSATFYLGQPTRDSFKTGPLILMIALEGICDQWSLPHLVFDIDDEAWLGSDRPTKRQRSLRYIRDFANCTRVTILASPEVERRLHTVHSDWVDDVTQFSGPTLYYCPHCYYLEPHPLRPAYRELVTMSSRPGKVRVLLTVDALEQASLKELREAVANAYTDYSHGTIRRYATELADDHNLLRRVQDAQQTLYSLTPYGMAGTTLIEERSGEIWLRHPLGLDDEATCNVTACTVCGTEQHTIGLQRSSMYSVDEESASEEQDNE